MQIVLLRIVLMQISTCKLYRNRSYNTNLYCSNSYNMNSDRVTDSHFKLIILDNTQECLNYSHHKIAFHGVFVS